MLSWWHSLSIMSNLVAMATWGVVVLGILSIIFGWRQTKLQEQVYAAEREKTNRKITELQPKPLKDRIITYLDAVDPQILQLAKEGRRQFQIRIMTNAQVTELQQLCKEDRKHAYIIWVETGNVMIGTGGAGTQGGIGFSVTDELLK